VIHQAWRRGSFTLLASREQVTELRNSLAKPKIASRIQPHDAGLLINNIVRLAEYVSPLPAVSVSPDPDDNVLLAMAEAGRADYLVTGDKVGLLPLVRHGGARIITAREFVGLGWFSSKLR